MLNCWSSCSGLCEGNVDSCSSLAFVLQHFPYLGSRDDTITDLMHKWMCPICMFAIACVYRYVCINTGTTAFKCCCWRHSIRSWPDQRQSISLLHPIPFLFLFLLLLLLLNDCSIMLSCLLLSHCWHHRPLPAPNIMATYFLSSVLLCDCDKKRHHKMVLIWLSGVLFFCG